MKFKDVAFLGGGDWADASVTLLAIPADLDLKVAHEEYASWRRSSGEYLSFTDWIRKNKRGQDSTVELFWED